MVEMLQIRNHIWERPLMTSDFRVGRGLQNEPPKPDVIGQKLVDNARTTKMLLDSKVRAKITIMLKIKKISKPFFTYENKNCNDLFIQCLKVYNSYSSKNASSWPLSGQIS